MKRHIMGIWLIFVALSIPTISFAEETIRLTNGDWAPYMSKNLKHYGITSHIVTEAYKLEGIKVKYGFFPWARGKLLAQDGKWDGATGWSYSDERAKHFLYSDSIMEFKVVFFHLKKFFI